MAAAQEIRGQEHVDDVASQHRGQDPRPQGQDVGVVVLAGQAGRVLVVAQRGPDPMDLVGGNLLPLPRPAYNDAHLRPAADDMAGTSGAEGRVVHGLLPVGAQVVDFVAELPQMGHYRQLERVAGVIIGDGDLH